MVRPVINYYRAAGSGVKSILHDHNPRSGLWIESFGQCEDLLLRQWIKTANINHDKIHGWMDDLRFYVLFNSILVISGRFSDDNEMLCAMEHRLRLRRFHLE